MKEIIPANGTIKVYVAASNAPRDGLAKPRAVVVPDYDTWNDHHRQYFATLYVADSEGIEVKFPIRFMFQDRLHTAGVLDELIAEHGPSLPIEAITQKFVTLLPDQQYYRTVVELLGFDHAIAALRLLNDAIVIRTESDDETLNGLIGSEEFHIGVLRHHTAATAFRRGARYFRRALPPTTEDAAQKFDFRATIKSADNEAEISFDFGSNPIFRDRIAVLIGKNGVGKTQLLKSMIDGLTGTTGIDGGGTKSGFEPVLRHSRVLVFSSVPSDPYPRRLGAWLGIDYDYFSVNAHHQTETDPLLVSLVSTRFGDDGAEFGTESKSRLDVIEEVLAALGLWQHLYLPLRPKPPGVEFPRMIESDGKRYIWIGKRLSDKNELLAAQQIDWSRTPVVLDDELRPRALSSGEYAMLRFACQAAAAIEPGSLLLLDEPETHLHPNYVSDLMEVLHGLLEATGSIAIIATHSAYIVREVFRESVKVLSVEDRELFIDSPRMQTFGSSIDTISQFVFGDTNQRHQFQQTLAGWATSVAPELTLDDIIQNYGDVLNAESLSFIARTLKRNKAAG